MVVVGKHVTFLLIVVEWDIPTKLRKSNFLLTFQRQPSEGSGRSGLFLQWMGQWVIKSNRGPLVSPCPLGEASNFDSGSCEGGSTQGQITWNRCVLFEFTPAVCTVDSQFQSREKQHDSGVLPVELTPGAPCCKCFFCEITSGVSAWGPGVLFFLF